ncbi:MAG: DUF6263 family protein [bacterium]|nr:DUF6263 family protein [bacterium]
MKRFTAVAVLLFSLGCANKAAIETAKPVESVLLKTKFVPGDTTFYKQSTASNMTMEMKGISQVIDMNIETELMHVVKDTGEVTKVDIVFNKVESSVKVGDNVTSSKEANTLQGRTITLNMDRKGKVSKVEGIEGIDYFRKSIGKPEQQFGSQFDFLPNKEVKTNDSWTVESDIQKTTYTFTGTENKEGFDCAKISIKGELNVEKPLEMPGVTAKIKLKGTFTGNNWFAVKEGKLIASKISTSMEGEQEIQKESTSMKILVYIDQTVNVKYQKSNIKN